MDLGAGAQRTGRRDERPAITPVRAIVWLALVLGALLALDLTQRFFLYEIRRRDRTSLLRQVRRPIKDVVLRAVHGLPGELEAREELPVFDLYLKPDDERELRARIHRVELIGTHDDFTRERVGGRLEVDGEHFDVSVKLRGRQYYHVVPPRPSLRIDIERGRSYRGATTFNLIEPFDKTTDQVFLWESARHGLVVWDATMGYLAMRGEPVALVQYVEQVRRETGDRNARPEGMFFRGTGERYSEGADPGRCGAVVERVVAMLADPEATIAFEQMEEVLDVDRVRWFTALNELSGEGHGMININVKGFCDPVSLKAEFMMWDTRFGDWNELEGSSFGAYGTQILRVDRFRDLHDDALYELAVERVEPMLAAWEEFHAEFAELFAEDRLYWFPRGGPDGGLLRDRSAKLKRLLRGNAAAIRATLEGGDLAFHVDAEAREIALATEDRGRKVVTALRLADGAELPLDPPVSVHGRYREHRPVLVVPIPASIAADAIVGVVAHNAHTGVAVEARASASPLAGETVRPAPEAPLALPDLPAGFVADHADRAIEVGPGLVTFEGALRIPRGWSVRVAPGTTLAAGPAALLEVRGDLVMRGTADEPIRIRPGGSDDWGALAVSGDRARPPRVELAWVEVVGGSGSDAGFARYTGSVAIYFADVELDHLSVADGRAEDAINLKNCTFTARDCTYRRGAGDAVDYDFSIGTDLRTRVEQFPDDGIDISGSRVRIEDAELIAIGDKGLSLGEGSAPEVVRVRVAGAKTACVVKDGTRADVRDLHVVDSLTAVALYRKKEAFGPPHARFSRMVAVNVEALAIAGHGSELVFEDSVRVMDGGTPVRPFEGVETRLVADLDTLDEAALFSREDEPGPAERPDGELR